MLHTQENGGGKLTHRLHLHSMFFVFFILLINESLTMIIQMELKRGHL